MKYILFGDANSPHLYKWYVELNKRYDVHVISLNKSINYKYKKLITIDGNVNQSGGNIKLLLKAFTVIKLFKQINPTVVNAHYITSYGLLAAFASLFLNFKLVLSAWGSDILVTPQKSKLYKWVTQFALLRASFVTSDSINMSQEILELKNNADVITFPMGITEKQIYRDTIKSNTFTFLSLRALVANSNVDLIIDAFSQLLQEYPDTRLIIANSGEDKHVLENKAASLSCSSKIKFVGLLDAKSLAGAMQAAHSYITVPTSDALSVSLIEAMASELSIIASDLPANRELLNENNSLLIEPTVENIYLAMKNSIEIGDEPRQLIYRNCRRIVEEKALWSNNIKNYFAKLDKHISM